MSELTDPREIRKALRVAAYHGDRIDGKPADYSRISSIASTLARHCRHLAEARGLSGEDEMTILAYHALLQCEKLTDRMLDEAMLNPNRQFIVMDAKAKDGDALPEPPK